MAEDCLGTDVGFLFFNCEATSPVFTVTQIAVGNVLQQLQNPGGVQNVFGNVGGAFETARMNVAPSDPPDLTFRDDVPNFAETADFFVL